MSTPSRATNPFLTPACKKMYFGYALTIAIWLVVRWMGHESGFSGLQMTWHPEMSYPLTIAAALCLVLAWIRGRRKATRQGNGSSTIISRM